MAASPINLIAYLFHPIVPYRLIIGILNLLPSSFCKFLSMVDTHDAQVMPVICKTHFSSVAPLSWFDPSRWGLSGRASEAQPWWGGSGAPGCTAALLASGWHLRSPVAVSWINAQYTEQTLLTVWLDDAEVQTSHLYQPHKHSQLFGWWHDNLGLYMEVI